MIAWLIPSFISILFDFDFEREHKDTMYLQRIYGLITKSEIFREWIVY